MLPLVAVLFAPILALAQECPDYVQYASERHPPFSSGIHELPSQRPSKECRTYVIDAIEKVIYGDMNDSISDPDLYRLFANTWPSTLDTTVKWTGFSADNPEEEVGVPSYRRIAV